MNNEWQPIETAPTGLAARPKGRFSFRSNRSRTRVTYKGMTPVTCPLCLKLLGNNVTAKTA